MTETKHENKQTVEINNTCFCEESLIDKSFLVLEILRLHNPKKPMVNRVNNSEDGTDFSIIESTQE